MRIDKKGIMNASEYCVVSLKHIQKIMQHNQHDDETQKELLWAIGGIIILICAKLIQSAQETFEQSMKDANPDARTDLLAIKQTMNEFIDSLIGQA